MNAWYFDSTGDKSIHQRVMVQCSYKPWRVKPNDCVITQFKDYIHSQFDNWYTNDSFFDKEATTVIIWHDSAINLQNIRPSTMSYRFVGQNKLWDYMDDWKNWAPPNSNDWNSYDEK